MSGFHTATICAACDPPVVAISTGNGSRCPQCGHVETWELPTTARKDRPDGALARQLLRDTAVRSDADAQMIAELARRLLDHGGKAFAQEARTKELEEELAELRDLADLVADADITALPPELVAMRQRWYAEGYIKEVAEAEAKVKAGEAPAMPGVCPHCLAGEPSVWDSVLDHFAHPHPTDAGKLKFCHSPWRDRCRRCSGDPKTCVCASSAVPQ